MRTYPYVNKILKVDCTVLKAHQKEKMKKN